MGTRKCILVSSVLVVWLISGYSAHSLGSGRSAKILEEPIVPATSSYEVISRSDQRDTALEDISDRSLSMERNMMLFRSVLSISMRLLGCFVVIRLLGYGLTRAGILKSSQPVPIVPFPAQPNLLYTVDVNHNPGLALQGTTYASDGALLTGSGLTAPGLTATGLTATSTGAAAGASTGTAPINFAPVPASGGGYLTAASTNQRPNFLPPGGRPPPRFRLFGFGGPRHPPLRRPPHMMPPHLAGPVSQHNLGEETHYVDTHSHLFVMPDGSQARIPIGQTAIVQHTKPSAPVTPTATSSNTDSSSSASNSQQDSKSSASSTDGTTERAPVETVNVSTSSSSSASAERRSSNVFREKSHPQLHQLQHQPYDDWNLHFSPGA